MEDNVCIYTISYRFLIDATIATTNHKSLFQKQKWHLKISACTVESKVVISLFLHADVVVGDDVWMSDKNIIMS